MRGTRFVVLLRAVNVGGRTLPMAGLRAAAQAAGFTDCATYIQSGNLLLTAEATAPEVERRVEALIAAEFGLAVPAIARAAADFARTVAANPFPAGDPKLVHLVLARREIAADAPALLAERAAQGEQVVLAGGGLWIDYRGGVGRSKLTPTLIDRLVGSPATARNANSAGKLVDLARIG